MKNFKINQIKISIHSKKTAKFFRGFIALLCILSWTFLPIGERFTFEIADRKVSLAPPVKYAHADTVLFTENCNSGPTQPLANSTTTTGGTWSAEIALINSNTTTINSGGALGIYCIALADALDTGIGHTISVAPTTHEYYVRANLFDGGNIPITSGMGVMMNYINTTNFYACLYLDDPSNAVLNVYILKNSTGGNSTLASSLGVSGIATGEIVECRISYSGSNPTITVTNITDTVQYLTVTDSSSPLTETQGAGVFCGATPARSTDECETSFRMDNISLTDVPDAASPPTVTTTNPATNIGVASATLGGNITAIGGSSPTIRGFAWGTSSALLSSGAATTTETGSFSTGTFSQNISGFFAGVIYYFRAYATNPSGTGYGSIESFTAGTDTSVTRKMRLFEGFTIKLISGKLIIHQI